MIGLDILFVAIMGYGVFRGWHSGLLKQAFSLVGVYVGLLLAWALYAIIGEKVAPHLGTEVDVAKLFVFLLIWLGVPVACGIIATMLTRMVKFVYLGGLNGIAGAVLGGVKYFVLLGCLLNVLYVHNFMGDSTVDNSALCRPMMATSSGLFSKLYAKTIEYKELLDKHAEEHEQMNKLQNGRGEE